MAEPWLPIPVDEGYPPAAPGNDREHPRTVRMSEQDCLPEWAATGNPYDAEKELG